MGLQMTMYKLLSVFQWVCQRQINTGNSFGAYKTIFYHFIIHIYVSPSWWLLSILVLNLQKNVTGENSDRMQNGSFLCPIAPWLFLSIVSIPRVSWHNLQFLIFPLKQNSLSLWGLWSIERMLWQIMKCIYTNVAV